jgi:RNA polymerase sigma-70 factor (ECF subfamily)
MGVHPFSRRGASVAELEAVYRAEFARYASLAAAILRDLEAGRDAVQEAFAQAVRQRGHFRREGPLEAWLWRLVVNAALTERRRRQAPVATGELSDGAVEPDDDRGVRAALDTLPERQRLVLFLRYYADLDYRSIADALGIASGTVAATLHTAHAALRRQLTEEVPG